MENHNTQLAPGFTLNDLVPAPANVAIFWCLLGPGGFNSLYQMFFQKWNRFSLCGPRTSQTPICSWGFTLPTRAPAVIKLWSFRLCTPPVYRVLMEFKPSPFSFLHYFVHFLEYSFFSAAFGCWGRGMFSILCPLSASKSMSLPSMAFSPSSSLCTAYLLSSLVQVVHIVVLILISVF